MACLALFLLVAGCADHHLLDGGGEPDASRPWGPREFLDAERELLCALAIRCEPCHPISRFEQGIECHPSAPWDSRSKLLELVAAGRVGFDSAAARAHLDSLASSSCSDWLASRVHGDAFHGLSPSGAACQINVECPQAHSCIGDACPSRCVGWPGLDERCNAFFGGCQSGLRCVLLSTSDEFHCYPTVGLGETCAANPCESGLYCGRGARCESWLAEAGESCEFPRVCMGDLVCVGEGPTARCGAGRTPGEACSGTERCAPGARCEDGRCVAISGPFEPCGPYSVCPLPFYCNDDRCDPRPIAGQRCGPAGECAQGVCAEGFCRTRPPGSTCSVFEDPPLGACDSGPCASDTCPSPAAAGDTCLVCMGAMECRVAEDMQLRCLPTCGP